MSTFTKGPWTVGRRVNCFIDIYHSFTGVKGAITNALCRVQSRDSWIEESEANARLISAAPDLLSVVKELEESANYWSEYDVPIGIVERIRAALAKADGRKL